MHDAAKTASTEYSPSICSSDSLLLPDRSSSRGKLALHGVKDPFSEKGKSCSAITLSFDQFQLCHVPFNHAIVDPPGETSPHSVFVFFYPRGKRLQFGKVAALHLGEPSIQVLS